MGCSVGSVCWSASAVAQEVDDQGVGEQEVNERPFGLSLRAELGFNAPVYHRIQFSQDGTYIDYVDEGGQGVLFPFQRYSVETKLSERHRLVFLWQPLDIETRVRARRDLIVDGAIFEEGRPVVFRYSFPFYRLSYDYDLSGAERTELGVGGGVQIRNATIGVEAADGELRRERRDVGLVPLLKFRAQHRRDSGWWFGTEIDGFYAPIRYLNISDSDVEGAIWDASLRVGGRVSEEVDAFLNLRYFGGGAEGTSSSQAEDSPSDGFTRNWINLVILSLGFQLQIR